eukprot:349601-Chlamydomonas_euryale.AAC.8
MSGQHPATALRKFMSRSVWAQRAPETGQSLASFRMCRGLTSGSKSCEPGLMQASVVTIQDASAGLCAL